MANFEYIMQGFSDKVNFCDEIIVLYWKYRESAYKYSLGSKYIDILVAFDNDVDESFRSE